MAPVFLRRHAFRSGARHEAGGHLELGPATPCAALKTGRNSDAPTDDDAPGL